MHAADDWLDDSRIVRRVVVDGAVELDPDTWPLTVPAVAQVVREGLDLGPGLTFLVGENGSGKSTLIEGLAMAYGLPAEGGSTKRRPCDSAVGVAARLLAARRTASGDAPAGLLPPRRDDARVRDLPRRPRRSERGPA
ncbi:AAA family ATPase [Agromyces sp. G08B096]|uniref:AAA family ATPase n=1 Tax=Agromyces sp. G08B096 TaxID=3156399 RepID=A0AAU7WBP0_9MICO